MTQHSTEAPDLIADIGGTNARFALATPDKRIIYDDPPLSTKDYPSLIEAAKAYLSDKPQPRRAAIAVASPITGDLIKFTSNPWKFSKTALEQELSLEKLEVLNDFTALALALPLLGLDERRQVGGGGTAVENAPIGLIGPGTGLGVSGLVWSGHHWIPLETEGGHVTFSPANEREWAIGQILRRRFGHVSPERVLAGPGWVEVYTALAELDGWKAEDLTPGEITRRALAGTCPHCLEVQELFCAALGTAAGNLALTLGARGGVYIGGGIVPRLGEFFDRSAFRARFEAKGRFNSYLAAIPTWVITADHPALRGAAAALD